MFPNLNAEQARYGHTNQKVADILNLTRVAYEGKKKRGYFSPKEINALCDLYHCEYKYLFSEQPIPPDLG